MKVWFTNVLNMQKKLQKKNRSDLSEMDGWRRQERTNSTNGVQQKWITKKTCKIIYKEHEYGEEDN